MGNDFEDGYVIGADTWEPQELSNYLLPPHRSDAEQMLEMNSQ